MTLSQGQNQYLEAVAACQKQVASQADTIHEIAEVNPSIVAKALKINLTDAGDLILFAMELSVVQDKIERRNGKVSIDALDTEISHYLGQLDTPVMTIFSHHRKYCLRNNDLYCR